MRDYYYIGYEGLEEKKTKLQKHLSLRTRTINFTCNNRNEIDRLRLNNLFNAFPYVL